MKTAAQTELANYVANTVCDFDYRKNAQWEWMRNKVFQTLQNASDFHEKHFEIRIALTEYGLPSHLPPHNPAGLTPEQITEGGKYRCISRSEADGRFTDRGEYWHPEAMIWMDGKADGPWHWNTDANIRVPADTPFPDWEEISKAATEESSGVQTCAPCPMCGAGSHGIVLSNAEIDLETGEILDEATVKEPLTVQPAPEIVSKEKYDALKDDNVAIKEAYHSDIAMMNERLEERTQGMLSQLEAARHLPSAKSFRAGWEAGSNSRFIGSPKLEEALREHMEADHPIDAGNNTSTAT